MQATRLDGRAAAKAIGAEIESRASAFSASTGKTPTVAVVRIGADLSSVWYANAIKKSMAAHGMEAQLHVLAAGTGENEVIKLVSDLNQDDAVHGILVQEPLPSGIDGAAVKQQLSPQKDVDGVHEVNAGRLALASPKGRLCGVGAFFVPATPAGAMELLRRNTVDVCGKVAVVVGRSSIVGKPMALLLLRENATVIVCHSRTRDLRTLCRQADVLCVGIGRPEMVRGDWIKPGSTVIDFGVNEVGGKMVGDVAFEEAAEVAGMITPVPGGTGPMTNIMLCVNVLDAAVRQTPEYSD